MCLRPHHGVLYPSEVERILLSVGDVAPHHQLVVDRPGTLDELSLLRKPAHHRWKTQGIFHRDRNTVAAVRLSQQDPSSLRSSG